MKHKIIKISIIVFTIACSLLLLWFAIIPQYQNPTDSLDNLKTASASSVISKPFEMQTERANEILQSEELFDPMSLVSATFDIYVPTQDVDVRLYPKESYVYKQLYPGEAVMYRQDMGNGYHKVQDIDGDIYYITDEDLADNMEFIEKRTSAITHMQEIPEGSIAFTVKYDGDRVLRFTKSLILDDNIAAIIEKGTTVYKVRDYEQIFFVVTEDGMAGYMNSQCLEIAVPEESPYDIVTEADSTYDYYEMLEDIVLLTKRYSDDLKVVDIGYSTLGHAIPALLLGKQDAQYKIFVQASLHAREYASTAVLMKQLEKMLYHLDNPTLSGTTYRHILDEVAYYIVPMANPDGVMLSQIGIISIEDEQARQKVLDIRSTNEEDYNSNDYRYYFEQWKGNINGVDLNRNFDANWDMVHDDLGQPSNNGYKGPSVFSEVETLYMKKFVDMEDVKITVSYHTAGDMIFWWYFQTDDFYNVCYDFARDISRVSRYDIMSKAQSRNSHGGLKDYAVMMGKPSVTYEISKYSSPIPPASAENASNLIKVLPVFGEWLIGEMHDYAQWLQGG